MPFPPLSKLLGSKFVVTAAVAAVECDGIDAADDPPAYGGGDGGGTGILLSRITDDTLLRVVGVF